MLRSRVYTDFSSGVWRNFIIFGLAVVGFYKFAPSPTEDNYITRWIAHYKTPNKVWESINFNHLVMSAQGCDDVLLVTDAKRPPIHRYRYPQSVLFLCFYICSPLCSGVMVILMRIICLVGDSISTRLI